MEALELRYVAPKDVHLWWGTIKPGVEKALTKQDAIPEDVYLSLKTGQAQLFLGMLGGVYHGFCVCQKQDSALFIWLCYATADGATHLFYPNLKAIAKQGGMARLRFSSSRMGWERLAANYGFKKTTVVYEAEV